ncbi:MAG TPA: hypothetical protein VGN88_09215 [Phycisphaerae bacterium]
MMIWEPGIFGEAAYAHQALIQSAAATLTGTGLVMGAALLGGVLPGMVMQVAADDDSISQVLEILAVADSTHATLSALRGRGDEGAVMPLFGGSVIVTLVTFQPQIAAIGDELLSLVGVASDRQTAAAKATSDLRGFRTAAVFGVLAAVFRTLSAGDLPAWVTAKRGFYEKLYAEARLKIHAKVGGDADGIPARPVSAGVVELVRQ